MTTDLFAHRDKVIAQLRARVTELEAELVACRDRYATQAENALADISRLEAELVAARSTVDRVQDATTALTNQAAEFLAHHNPACECEWGQAIGQAAERIQAALAPPADVYEKTTGHQITCCAGFTDTCTCTTA